MSGVATASASAESDLVAAILAALRSSPEVQAAFGAPARIFDGETQRPFFPHASLERIETEPAGASGHAGQEFRVTLATASRHGGRQEALRLVGVLRATLETADTQLPSGRIVLLQAVYSDVVRSADRRLFRGLLRIRIITEEVLP